MKGNLKMVQSMVMENNFSIVKMYMKEVIIMTNSMEKAHTLIMMAIFTKVNSLMVTSLETGN